MFKKLIALSLLLIGVFTLTACGPSKEEQEIKDLLEDAKSVLILPSGIVNSDMDLLTSLANDVVVSWESSNTAVIANDGTVTRPANGEGNATVTLTATLSLEGQEVEKEFEVIVAEEALSTEFQTVLALLDSTLGDIVEFEGIVNGLFDGGYFLSDGTNSIGVYYGDYTSTETIAIGDTVKVKGEYAKYNTLFQISNLTEETKVTAGDGTNPLTPTVKTVAEMLALDSTDATIHGKLYTVSGFVELRGDYDNVYLVDGDDAILIYYYSLDDSLAALEDNEGLKITITTVYYTNHGTNGPMLVFDGGEDDIAMATLTDAEALAADVIAADGLIPDAAVADITLPTAGPNGSTYTNWVSDKTAQFSNAGVFGARGTESITVTFTATATKGTETGTVSVEVVVPVNSTIAEVKAMDNGDLFETTGVVYEESYYGFFITAGGENLFVFSKDLLDDVKPGDSITVIGSLNVYKGLPQVNVISETITAGTATLPTPIIASVEGAVNDVYPRGTVLTVTGTVSLEGQYDDVTITGLDGGALKVYYRSNADELEDYVGKIITLDIVTYQKDEYGVTVLFQGVKADVTEVTAFTVDHKLQTIADNINLGDLSGLFNDITLPATDDLDATATITWATSDATVIEADGTIHVQYGTEGTATLTATVTIGTDTLDRTFNVVVIDGDTLSGTTIAAALLEEDAEVVIVEGVVSGFTPWGNPFIQDPNGVAIYLDHEFTEDIAIGDKIIVRGELDTYYKARMLVDVVLLEEVSSDNAVYTNSSIMSSSTIGNEDDVTKYSGQKFRMLLKIKSVNDGYGNVEFYGGTDVLVMDIDEFAPWFDTYYNNEDSVIVEFILFDLSYGNVRIVDVKLPNATPTTTEKLDWVESLIVPVSYTKTDIELDTALSNFYYDATVVWTSGTPATLSAEGTVTRPAFGGGNITVTMTAVITVDSTDRTVTFDVEVVQEDPVFAPCGTELFISEYVEGGGYNKVIEIFNPTAETIDLSTYKLYYYSNANTTYTELQLTGSLASGEVLVLANTGVDASIASEVDVLDNFINHNGNDSYELYNGSTLIDYIGNIGSSSDYAKDVTLVRNMDIHGGNTTYTPGEWVTFGKDTLENVGSHVINPDA